MSIWQILEIDSTSDLSVIKKAYARKLKVHHPEDDPKGFQTLKEAYDSAVSYAKSMSKNTGPVNKSIIIQEFLENKDYSKTTISYESETGSPPFFSFRTVAPNLPFDREAANHEFIEQMNRLYTDFFERIKPENWEELLNRDALWDIGNRISLEPMILSFLSSHYYLPPNVWKLLDLSFNFRDMDAELRSEYNIPFANHVKKILSQPFPLNYSFIQKVKASQYDCYLEFKENAHDFLQDEEIKAAKYNLNKAKKLCKSDPDLIRMEGIVCLKTGNADRSLELLNQALSINPEDLEGLYFRAYIFFTRRQFSAALKDLSIVLSAVPMHHESLLLTAKCHLELKNVFEAKDLITRALSVNEKDSKTLETLSLINKKLKARLWVKLLLRPWEFRQTAKQLLSARKTAQKAPISKTILNILGKLLKWSLYAVLFVVIAAIAIATKVGGLVLLFCLIRHFTSKKQ